jgi:RIO-like serine/threonine protein kinase
MHAIRFDIQKFNVLVKQDVYVIKYKQNIVKHDYINDFIKMYSYFWSYIVLYRV